MWFKGLVAEAITKAKLDKSVFIVFVEGDDDLSAETKKLWESGDVKYICKQEGFVCLNLRTGSDALKQFSAIYPVVSVPIVFFIGTSGKPIEVLSGKYDETRLMEAINRVVEIHDAETKPNVSVPSSSSIPLEERVRKAKELVAQRREQKANEQKEAEREKELKRREEGRSVSKQKAEVQEREIREAAEQRRKAKIADKEALNRIREQIAQDRAEKARRYDVQQSDEQKQLEAAKLQAVEAKLAKERAEKAAQMTIARLQFRIPNEPVIVEEFAADTQLEEVYEFIAQHLSFKKFSLLKMYPRQELSDKSRTLRDLDLLPSAVLLVLPDGGVRSVASQEPSSWFQSLVHVLFWPLSFVYVLVCGLFGSGSRAVMNTPSVSNQATTKPVPVKSTGNVVRMTDRREEDNIDDKDRPTWNGNSTQQL